LVSSETLQIIIDAKDLVSNKANQVKNALKQTGQAAQQANNQAANSTSRVTSAYERVRTKVTNVWNSIKNTIKNSSTYKAVSESALAQPFMNAAEKIKQRYSSMAETVKSKLREITGTTGNEANNSNSKLNILSSGFTKLSSMGTSAITRLKSGFSTLHGTMSTVKGKISNLASSFSGLQGVIAGALGALGVSSLKAFTIDAAIAREKINAVTKSLVGTGAEYQKLNSIIKSSVAGTTLGFNNVAKAVNTVGLRYHMTAQQLNGVPPVMAKVGLMAQAMGKSNEEAAAMMEHAYDGLQGKWRSLAQIFGMSAKDMKQALLDAGWSGASDDVEGYNKALEKLLDKNPQLKEMMNSTEYKMESLKMTIKGIGTEIGLALLPYIKGLLTFLQDLAKNHPGLLKLIVTIGVIIGVIASVATVLLPIISLFSALSPVVGIVVKVLGILGGVALDVFAALMTGGSVIAALGGPITVIIGLVVALIAIFAYFYFTNEDFRNGVNNLANTIKGVLVAAFNWLMQVMKPVIDSVKKLAQAFVDLLNGNISFGDFLMQFLETFAMIVTAMPRLIGEIALVLLQELGKLLLQVGAWLRQSFDNVLQWMGDGFADLMNGAVKFLASIWNSIVLWGQATWINIQNWFTFMLPKIIEQIQGIVRGVIEWLRTGFNNVLSWLGEGFANLMNGLFEYLGGLWDGLVEWGQTLWTNICTWFTTILPLILQEIWNLFMNILTGIGTFFVNLITGLWNWQVSVWTTVYNFLLGLYNSFVLWASNIVNGFITWISTLPGRMYTWLLDAYNRAVTWATQTIAKFKDAASKSVSGFIQWLSTLPGKAWTWLINTLGKIASFASQAIEKMKNAAKDACDKFIQYFKDLPQKVWDELMRIGDKILQAGGTLAQKARELGQRIVDELMAPFKFGSPGIISRSVAAEMVYLKEFLDDSVHGLVKSASNVGTSVTDALSSHLNLNQNSLEALQDENLILQTVKDYEEGTLTLKHESKEEELNLLRDLKDLFTELLSILSTDEKDTNNTAVIINSMENASGTDILGVLREHISDRDIIRQIASSPDFQELDTRNKNSILNRLNRHL